MTIQQHLNLRNHETAGSFLIVELMKQEYHLNDACKGVNNRIIKEYS